MGIPKGFGQDTIEDIAQTIAKGASQNIVSPLATAGIIAGGTVAGGFLGEHSDTINGALTGGALAGAGIVAYNIIKRGV